MASLWSVRQDFMSWIKSKTALTSLVGSEIRELEWQGTKFSYPNVRIRLNTFTPTTSDCNRYKVEGVIYVFDDEPSSEQTDRIGSAILTIIHGKSTSHGSTKFVGFTARQFGADRIEESNVWQGRIEFSVAVS